MPYACFRAPVQEASHAWFMLFSAASNRQDRQSHQKDQKKAANATKFCYTTEQTNLLSVALVCEKRQIQHLEDSMEAHEPSLLASGPAAPAAPWLRVHLLGPFQIAWVDPASGQVTPLPAQKLRGQNASTALGLFKALLCCPDRFATRAWLNEQLWPNARQRSAEERLNDVVSSLRALLRPQGCTAMFVHFVYGSDGRGAGFRLDAYPALWCDVDALEWYVKHALLLDRRGQDSTACWEQAYLLAERGPLLPEHLYEEWARPKREYLEGLGRDTVHRWTALLRQMGHIEEAILRLRAYWLEHPTDEDALRPLLEMLGECERFGEAEESYAKARAALAEDRHEPDERTVETIEAVRALKVQGSHSAHSSLGRASLAQMSARLPFSVSDQQQNFAFSPSGILNQNMPVDSIQRHKVLQSEHLLRIHSLEAGIATMKETRRRLLQYVLSISASMIARPQLFFEAMESELAPSLVAKWTRMDDITLAHLEGMTRSYWKLFYHVSSKYELLPGLSGHLQTILQFLQSPQPGSIRNRLYALASEAALIVGTILFDMQDHQYASMYYRFAITAAKEAGNNALRAIGLGRLSFLPIYTDTPQQALPLLQEARALLPSSSYPMIRSWLALIEAEAVAHLHDESACEKALAYAEMMQGQSESEEEALWTQINDATLPGYQGVCYLQLQSPTKALEILQSTLHHLTSHAHRHRSIVLTDMAMAMIQMEEIEEACYLLRQALEITTQTKSLMVILRMQGVRSSMEKWKQTPSVKELDGMIGDTVPFLLLTPSF
jgi:DNA-binding SARP family transcriptional activator